jgi:hypothetical protein
MARAQRQLRHLHRLGLARCPPARPGPCLSCAQTRMLVFVPTRRVTSWGAGEQHGLRRLPVGGLRVGAAGDCVGGCVRAGTGHLSFLHRLTPFDRPGLPCAPHAPHLALGLVSVPPDRLAGRPAASSRLSIQVRRYVCAQGVFGQLPLHALDESLHRARLRPLHSCLTPPCSRALRPCPVSRWPPLPTQSQVWPPRELTRGSRAGAGLASLFSLALLADFALFLAAVRTG